MCLYFHLPEWTETNISYFGLKLLFWGKAKKKSVFDETLRMFHRRKFTIRRPLTKKVTYQFEEGQYRWVYSPKHRVRYQEPCFDVKSPV